MVLFQHGGGETTDWEDGKVQKRGPPIVYPAAGSHATFYESAIFVENGQEGSGLGCDNTSEPLRRLRRSPILVPNHPAPKADLSGLPTPAAGGKRRRDSTTGRPARRPRPSGREPFSWMAAQRSTSPRLPGGPVLGPAVTGAFCGAVATASGFVNLEAKSRLTADLTIFGIAVAWPSLSGSRPGLRWSSASCDAGGLSASVRAARQLYGRHWHTLVPIGLTAIPIVGAVEGVKTLLSGRRRRAADRRIGCGLLGPAAGARRPDRLAGKADRLGNRRGRRDRLREAPGRGTGERFHRLLWRHAAPLLAGGRRPVARHPGRDAIAITVIGAPLAVWKYVEWQFVQQEILFEDRSLREAFRGSSRLVRGRWWHTVRVAGFLWLLSVIAGPVLGFALIFANFSLFWINVFGSVVFALLVPYVASAERFCTSISAARGRSGAKPGACALRAALSRPPAPGLNREKSVRRRPTASREQERNPEEANHAQPGGELQRGEGNEDRGEPGQRAAPGAPWRRERCGSGRFTGSPSAAACRRRRNPVRRGSGSGSATDTFPAAGWRDPAAPGCR